MLILWARCSRHDPDHGVESCAFCRLSVEINAQQAIRLEEAGLLTDAVMPNWANAR